ncbi:MAG: inorganic phosphate transporter [Prevotellaceae bacterium]|jgi:phosphate/sulfate permease|nr:inorganic phosphate transporter [Prevotellaceae bacterium]
MESIYLFILIVLIALAIVDLTVGVANDAANFLSSAIGSKVSSRKVILAVASVGLIAGTLTSNGLMEIARSGVFHPGMFTFHDVMIIFLAVMICDVIMLDLFNTFGLPTSTTVSLIFELLGAAMLVALYKIWTAPPETVGILSEYINSTRAMTLISAILASVVIAFTFGSVIMFISRLIFSFRYKRSFRNFGAIWCGLCMTAIAYFIIFKGLKYSTIISKESFLWLSNNMQMLLIASFVGFSIFMAILQHLFRINILKIIVLAGTCALAIAFAGSDLANFIGVTMAGVDSYAIAATHAAAGGDVSTLMMSELAKPVAVNPLYLMLAGGVMILTLWFSKRAKTVTETGVKLSRQDDGFERFGSTPASRALVHSATSLNKRVSAFLPDSVNRFIDKRFKPSEDEKKDKASFDLIRAAVNITVAALLISTATSMKLTLSTTYVAFMVAMGTSLADRAWGRESAVYRVSGVLTVISGWFMTALFAFSAGAITALLLMWGGNIALAGLLALCVFMLIQSSKMHKKRAKRQSAEEKELVVERSSVIEQCNESVCHTFGQMGRIYTETLNGLAAEDRKELRRLCKEARDLYEQGKERKYYEMLPTLDKLQEDAINTGHYYVQVIDYLSEVSKSLVSITKTSLEYIDNNHTGLSPEQVSDLEAINKAVSEVYSGIVEMIRAANFDDFDRILDMRDNMFDLFVEYTKSQIRRVKNKESSTRNSILYLNIMSETKAMILQSRNLMKAQRLFMGFGKSRKN